MTAPPRASEPRPLPGAFAALVLYAVRVCVPPQRALLLLLPCLGAVLFGSLAHVVDNSPLVTERFNTVSDGLFTLVLPLACLVVGDAVLGAEVRAGTFQLTWLSPTPLATIAVARWLAGWAIASGALVPAFAIAAIIAGLPRAILPLMVAVLAGTAAYIGLFLLVGAAVRRAALWSLAIVLLGERLLGTALAGIAQLSPQWLAWMTYGGLGPGADGVTREGVPAGWSAVVRLVIIAAVTLALCVRRLRNVSLVRGED